MGPGPRKPQPTITSPSLSPPAPSQPAMAMAPAEVEPAIAALAAKMQHLRESFDRLAACSPVPIPFRWEDLEVHLSSVEAAIAARFGLLGSASPRPEFAARGPTTTVAERFEHPVEHLVEEDYCEPSVDRGVREEAPESNTGEGGEELKNAPFCQEHEVGKGEVRVASDARRVQEGDEAGNEMEEGAIEASPVQDADEEEVSEGDDDESEEEEGEAKWPRPREAAAGGGEKALDRNFAAACANMDASTLVDMLCQSCRSSLPARRAFLPALLGAADPHALVVRAVGGFLARPDSMTYRSWGHCVAFLECVPHLTGIVKPSADTLEETERLAKDWKGMLVGKTGSCRDISRLAGWGLFTFLASYNIVLEFEADEIIRLFDNLPPQLKENCIDLCNRFGLIEKMTDSIHHLIGNGQPLDAMRLVCALNLKDTFSPLSIMHDFVEKAKKAAEEILRREMDSAESLNQDMARNINALMLSWTTVDECNMDSAQRNSIKKEISQLLHKYADKQKSLSGISAFVSTSYQKHNLGEQCLMQLEISQEEEQPRAQEFQQKPGEKRQRQQHQTYKTQQKQLHNQQEQGWGWQNSTGRRLSKNQKRNQRKKRWQCNKHPRFSSYPYSGIQGVPFAERARQIQFGST